MRNAAKRKLIDSREFSGDDVSRFDDEGAREVGGMLPLASQ